MGGNYGSSVVILSYNMHSVSSQERLEMLLEELSEIYWDVIVLVETWRDSICEKFTLETGHYWYGSGGLKGSCGIGFLVNERHQRHDFEAISPRLGYLNIKFGACRCRIFGVYLPDSGYPDEEVEEVYEQLNTCLRSARAKKLQCALAGALEWSSWKPARA